MLTHLRSKQRMKSCSKRLVCSVENAMSFQPVSHLEQHTRLQHCSDTCNYPFDWGIEANYLKSHCSAAILCFSPSTWRLCIKGPKRFSGISDDVRWHWDLGPVLSGSQLRSLLTNTTGHQTGSGRGREFDFTAVWTRTRVPVWEDRAGEERR